ncbi:MAG: terpene cyclase/mutase family protein [Planctomycetota bacterium]
MIPFPGDRATPLTAAVTAAQGWLLDRQHADGHWCGELEGDSILQSETYLLLAYLGRERGGLGTRLADSLRRDQQPHGGWALYPGGPVEVSSSVKAYLCLKLAGDPADADHMVRARHAILDAGGAERVNSFTRYYLALLGLIDYSQCPAVPPELMLLPKWAPFNIYEMSAWSRTILVPLSVLWAYQPQRDLPDKFKIDELFLGRPDRLPVCVPPETDAADPWRAVFSGVDTAIKQIEALGLKPFRPAALKKAEEWMLTRFADSDGLGAIFPPIIWSVVALKCRGYAEDSPEVKSQLDELESLALGGDGEKTRLQPCRSPVWDTAISLLALRRSGFAADSSEVRRGVRWLLEREIRTRGDWGVRDRSTEPSGWCFEYQNKFYPDVDDTAMVLMALLKTLPGDTRRRWEAELRLGEEGATVLASSGVDPRHAAADVDRIAKATAATGRGMRWLLAMQSKDGGWGAFDADNTRELFTKVPFADHNAMIDPSTADLTARMLELFGMAGLARGYRPLVRAEVFVRKSQEADGAWLGRWGVNYIYGTWQALTGLAAIGAGPRDEAVRKGADWLAGYQQDDGGWGETPATYDDPSLRGMGATTASQTAWATMGLVAAGRGRGEAVRAGADFLLQRQTAAGTWDEEEFTGTGFPRVFYLRYHLYRHYFPLMALGDVARHV